MPCAIYGASRLSIRPPNDNIFVFELLSMSFFPRAAYSQYYLCGAETPPVYIFDPWLFNFLPISWLCLILLSGSSFVVSPPRFLSQPRTLPYCSLCLCSFISEQCLHSPLPQLNITSSYFFVFAK